MKRIFINTILVVLSPSLAYSQSQSEDVPAKNTPSSARHVLVRMKPLFSPRAASALTREDENPKQADAADEPRSGFGFLAGYRFIDIADHTFRHDTHVDDGFLPRANQPGSAGTTELKTTHWALFGTGYLQKFSAVSLTFDAGLLVGINTEPRPGHSSFRKKNENDSRPDAQGAFIYSKPTYGLYSAVGFTYDVKKISLGAEGQLSVVSIESGWDRWGEDQAQSSVTQTVPSVGPKIGFLLDSKVRLEGSVQIGRSVHFGIALRCTF